MPKYDVKQVVILINRAKSGAIYKGDLIFTDGQPNLVIDWTQERGESDPLTVVKLDAKLLQACPPAYEADFVYQGPVDDPRIMQ